MLNFQCDLVIRRFYLDMRKITKISLIHVSITIYLCKSKYYSCVFCIVSDLFKIFYLLNMAGCGKVFNIIFLILIFGMAGVQIGLGNYYIRRPVNCERSTTLTYLTLVGGCCSIVAMIYLSFYCRRRRQHSESVQKSISRPKRDFGYEEEDEEERLIQ